ncbi:MAG TPA: ABC transporter permease [Clostridiaceae bacterium]|nr:ABC transporter permease [Clostridiaceae bacterium]
MQVYKLCLKIIKKNIPVMLIYIFIYLSVSIVVTLSSSRQNNTGNDFTDTKANIAFISGEETPLIEGLRKELGRQANFINLPDKKEAQQDALFFREVVYILRIPEGFTQKFMAGEEVHLEKNSVPDSAKAAYIDLAVDQYLNTARFFLSTMGDVTQESLVKYLDDVLSQEADVKLMPAPAKTDVYGLVFSYNYMAYSLSSILVLGMAAIMAAFNNRDLRNRVSCSPVRETAANLQIFLASLTFAGVAWLTQIAFCFFFDIENVLTMNTVYLLLNSLVFTVCGTAMGFLIGSVVKGNEAISAVTNVVVLGSCFICGVFVPAQLLGETTLRIASFTPTYWFVKANNQAAQLTQFDLSSVRLVLSDTAVIVCFALAFFALSLVIRKVRRFS